MDVRLAEDQLERLADLVAARLNGTGTPSASHLLNADELALRLGVTRRYVYDHAHELGAVKIGAGSKPRLRFDLEVARSMLDTGRQTAVEPIAPHRRSQRQRQRQSQAGSVLQIKGRRP